MAACERKLYRKRKVFGKIQSDCNTPAIITADDGKIRSKVGQAWNLQNEMNERDVARDTLSEPGNIPGLSRGEATFSWEIVGSGDLATVPEIDAYLRSAGLYATALKKLAIPDMRFDTMPARGTTITGVTSTATGTVKVQPQEGDRFLTVEVLTGTFQDGEAITSSATLGDGTTAVGTLSGTATDGGYTYRLRSDGFERITARSEEDGTRKEIYNAMTTFAMSIEAGGIASMDFTTTGITMVKARWIPVGSITGFANVQAGDEVSAASDAKRGTLLRTPAAADDGYILYMPTVGDDIASGDSITITASGGDEATCTSTGAAEGTWRDESDTEGITYYTTAPLTVRGSELTIGNTGAKPRVNTFSFDAGMTVVVTPDFNEDEGLAPAEITRRQPTGSLDPEYTSSATWDAIQDWVNGTTRAISVSVSRKGEQTSGNNVTLVVPNAQIQSDTDGNRDDFTIENIDFKAASAINSKEDEFELIFH